MRDYRGEARGHELEVVVYYMMQADPQIVAKWAGVRQRPLQQRALPEQGWQSVYVEGG